MRQALKEVPKNAKSEYIFLNDETKKPLGSIKKSFATALKKSGIQDFKFHDLRHTFASSLVRRGVDLYVVQKLLGHTTPKMTQRYAHLGSNQMKEAIEKIDIQLNNLLYNSKSTDELDPRQKHSGMTCGSSGNDSGINSTNLAQKPLQQKGVLLTVI